MTKNQKDLLIFGYGLGLIAAVFAIGGWIKHGLGLPVIILILCSMTFISVTALNWNALKPGYQAWMKVAHLIGGVVTTIIFSIIFFIIFTPISILLRIMGRDHLQRSFSKKSLSYWEKRNKIELKKERYHQQF